MIGRLLYCLGIRRKVIDVTGHRMHGHAIQRAHLNKTPDEPTKYPYRNPGEDLRGIQERLHRRQDAARTARSRNVVSIKRPQSTTQGG